MLEDTTVYNADGALFYKQGRPEFFAKACVTLCLVRYRNNNSVTEFTKEFIKRSSSSMFTIWEKNLHSEEKALIEIQMTEQTFDCAAIRVELYSSFSPCELCCGLLQEFIEQRPQCKLHIAFTCLYHRRIRRHRDALRSLCGCSNIRLDIFTDEEWRLLRERKILVLSPLAFHITIMWDCYWRMELLEIMPIVPTSGTVMDTTGLINTAMALPPLRAPTDHYNSTYVATKDELEAMDAMVKETIRREDRKRILLYVSVTVAIMALFIYVLIRQQVNAI